MASNKSKTISPKKSQNDSISKDFVIMDKDILRGLSEKEVEIEHLKTTVIALSQKMEILKDMEKDVQNAQSITHNSEEKRVELQVHIKQSSIQISEDAQKNKKFQDDIIAENKRLQEEVQKLKETVVNKEKEKLDIKNQLEKEKSDLQKEKMDMELQLEAQIADRENQIKVVNEFALQLQSKIREQEQIIRINADVANQLANQQQFNKQLDEQKKKLQKELDTASDYIVALEDKVYKANKTSLELLRQLKDSEIEIETLKNYIIELKQRIAVYIPAKDDAIDKRLAEFINNYPDRQKLKIMFLRESEGVYQFGSRRVAVRVDKDKINIRVGGGYLSIDEFLDQYTPAELEKMERKDPLKKFSEKVAIQKTIQGKEIKEGSPVRGGSPKRANGSPTRQIQ